MQAMHSRRGQSIIALAAVAGAGAAIALSAAPAAASSSAPRLASAHHHSSGRHRHASRVHIVGLVAAHHRHSLTVFARTATAGATTQHNQRLHISFARNVHARTHVPVGDMVTINALAKVHGHSLVIVRHNSESVSSSEATLLFGTVTAINGTELMVSEHARDNGDNEDGNDSQDGNNQGDGDRHSIAVDDSEATIIVDNGANPLAVGDTVAILGEVTDNTVVAEAIFGFSTRPAFLRGEVVSVNGNSVTVATGEDGMNRDSLARDRGPGDDGNTTSTFDLSDVALALNGSSARPSDLVPGDKIILLGPANPETGQVVAEVAFAFNGHDNHPADDNQGEDSQGD